MTTERDADTHDMPEPVACSLFLALDSAGNFVATEDGDQIADIAIDLLPGYRILEVIVTARPPATAAVEVAAEDGDDVVAADAPEAA